MPGLLSLFSTSAPAPVRVPGVPNPDDRMDPDYLAGRREFEEDGVDPA